MSLNADKNRNSIGRRCCAAIVALAMALAARPALAQSNQCPALTIGGITFSAGERAFADDATKVIGTLIFQGGATTLVQAVTGTNLPTNVTANTAIPGKHGIDVIFTNNVIENGPGADFVIFELDEPSPINVAIKRANGSLTAQRGYFTSPTPVSTIVNTPDQGPLFLQAVQIDLSDYGIPLGEKITCIRIFYDTAGEVATITAVGGLNVPPCDDGDPCTIDLCVNGVCTSIPDTRDDDGDGVPNCRDKCPNSRPGAVVDADGCENLSANAGGPYAKKCVPGGIVQIPLVGTAFGQSKFGATLQTQWTTSCAGATIANPSALSTTLSINTAVAGCPANCNVTLTASLVGGNPPPAVVPPVSSTATVTLFKDCNNNNVPDPTDIANGTSLDCNDNDIPDECDVNPTDPDGNGMVSKDCDHNNVPDECQADCDHNGIADVCELAGKDCDGNGILDICELAGHDCNNNGILDKCEADCNGNGIPDACDINPGDPDGNGQVSKDCNNNHIPDECDVKPNDPDGNGQVSKDCNVNNIPDECEKDCNGNGVPDDCDINPADPDGNGKVSGDCNKNNIPDECDINVTDPDGDGKVSKDCNNNKIPDECDVNNTDPDGNGNVSKDCNNNKIPDECEPDTDGDGVIDACDNCPGVANPGQEDANNNGIGDVCEAQPSTIACCLPDNSCVNLATGDLCIAQGGQPQGIGSTCATVNCQNGACDPNEPGISLLFSAIFRSPVCGTGCPTLIVASLAGLASMRMRRRRR